MFKKIWYFIRILARGDREYRALRLKIDRQTEILQTLVNQTNRIQRRLNNLGEQNVS